MKELISLNHTMHLLADYLQGGDQHSYGGLLQDLQVAMERLDEMRNLQSRTRSQYESTMLMMQPVRREIAV